MFEWKLLYNFAANSHFVDKNLPYMVLLLKKIIGSDNISVGVPFFFYLFLLLCECICLL